MLTVVERVLALTARGHGDLADVPTRVLARLAAVADERDFAAGEPLWSATDPANALVLVLDGEVRLLAPAREPERLLPGDAIDAAAVVRDGPRATAAIALTDSLVLSLPRTELWRLLGEEAELARALLQAVVGDRRGVAADRDGATGHGGHLDS